jgi:hypothetical protein
VAILGSAELDVRDLDERSLRLGPGEAEPWRHPDQGYFRRRDVDRDGEPDLLVRFDAREAGIAEGDTQVCLHGETLDGAAIEGCDTIADRRRGERSDGGDEDRGHGDRDDDDDRDRDDRDRDR